MTVRIINLQTGEETAREYTQAELDAQVVPFSTESLKHYRDENWSNSTVTLTNGAILKVNDRTRKDVGDTIDGMLDAGMSVYEGWNAENGVYDFTIQDFQEARTKALINVKKAFDAFNVVMANHENTPYTNMQDAYDDFDQEV